MRGRFICMANAERAFRLENSRLSPAYSSRVARASAMYVLTKTVDLYRRTRSRSSSVARCLAAGTSAWPRVKVTSSRHPDSHLRNKEITPRYFRSRRKRSRENPKPADTKKPARQCSKIKCKRKSLYLLCLKRDETFSLSTCGIRKQSRSARNTQRNCVKSVKISFSLRF